MEIMAGHIFLKNRSRYTRVKPASILWRRVWFCMAAFFTASLETPSMPATSAKSL